MSKWRFYIFTFSLILAALACNAPIGDESMLTTEAMNVPTAVPATATFTPTPQPVQAVSAELNTTEETAAPDPTLVPTNAPAETTVDTTQSEAEPTESDDLSVAPIDSAPEPLSGFNVETVSVQPASDGSWNIVGLVNNASAEAYSRLELSIAVYDANDTLLLTDLAAPQVYSIAAGESAPFAYNIFDVENTPPRAEVFVTNGFPEKISRAGLAVVAQTLSIDEDGNIHCTGALINNNAFDVTIDQVAAVAINGDGTQLNSAQVWAVNSFVSAGDVTPYRATMIGSAEAPQGCQVFIDARESITEPVSGIEIVDQQFLVDTFGNTHLVGELRNISDMPLQVQLVAGLYDDASNVVDADSLNMPITVMPGETAPFDVRTFSATSYNDTLRSTVSSAKIFLDQAWTTIGSEQVLLEGSVTNQKDDNGLISVIATVTNTSDQVAEFTQVTATLRNDAGQVVGTETVSIWDPISPGNMAEAIIDIIAPAGLSASQVSASISVRVEQ